MKHCIVGH